MEKGFFHPDRGYWQTLNEPTVETVASYPKGTVEVQIKPGTNFEWDGSRWVSVILPQPIRVGQEAKRQAAFVSEADPLFFQWQAGESTEEEWLAKRQEVRDRYPYPTE